MKYRNNSSYLILAVFFLIVISNYSCTDKKDDIRREINLGIKANYSNKHDVAIEHFEKVLSWEENNQEAYLNLARVYINMRDYDKSMEYLDKTIDIAPEYGEAYRSRAQLYSILGDRNAACKDYLKAEEFGVKNLHNYTKHCK